MKTEYRIETFDDRYARVMINRAIKNALEEERETKQEEQLSCSIFAGVVTILMTAIAVLINYS